MTSDSAPLAGVRILLISMYYAPEHSGSGPYVADTAEYLAGLGAAVDVVTTWPHYPSWKRPPGVENRWKREVLNGVRLRRVPTYVPARPNLLSRAVYELSFLAAAAPVAARVKPEIVLGCTPSLFGGVLAAAVSRLRHVPLIQLVQDVFTAAADQAGIAGAPRMRQLLARLEGASLRAAARLTIPAPEFIPALTSLGVNELDVTLIRNWGRVEPVPVDREKMRRRLDWTDRTVVLHTGNIGMKQALEDFVPTLRHVAVSAPDILFVFVGDGNQKLAFARAIRGVTNTHLLPPVLAADYFALLASADVLLVHERDSMHDMSLPSKLTSYFTSGSPVLAVTPRDSATAREVERAGAGLTVAPNDPSVAIPAIRRLTSARSRYGDAARAHWLKTLSPQTGLTQIAELIEDVYRRG